MLLEMTAEQIYLPDAPSIDGLSFRLFRDEADYASVVDLMNASSAADGVDDFVTVEWAKNYLGHTTDFDPCRDVLFAEIAGEPVALVRVRTRLLDDGTRLYYSMGSVLPQWRRHGLGRAVLHWAEERLREIARTQPDAQARTFRAFAAAQENGAIALLENEGYATVRYGFEMARPLSEPIPDLPLPIGVEVRPVGPEQYRQVWQAFAVLLPIQTVGVMGDERTYEKVVAVRVVQSIDAMTADWVNLPNDLLGTISNRIINEIKGINRVVYDISSKPPATIEWE